MKTAAIAACLLLPSAAAAAPVSGTTGNVALPLAALVGMHQPSLSQADQKALVDLLDARINFYWPIGRKITVQVDVVICKVSNVDITARACDLSFGRKKLTIKGRAAHELFATIAETGVPSDGAAGSIYESLSHMRCVIDPKQVFDRAGAGAECRFKAGPP